MNGDRIRDFVRTAVRGWPAWLFAAIAAGELVAHGCIQAGVVESSDWHAAESLVSEQWRDGDTIAVAPAWLDASLRQHLTGRIGLADAGRSDLALAERLWVLSARGRASPWAPLRPPDFEEQAGAFLVQRWDLGPSPVRYDLTGNIEQAEVFRGDRRCTWQRRSAAGGGLGQGIMNPAERHFCGPEAWLFVGESVVEDLELQPRHCIWQHPPPPGETIRTVYRNIPLGERVVLDAGIYYEHERMREHGPVSVRVLVGDVAIGTLTHQDGDGWERIEAPVPEALRASGARGDVTIEVSSPNPFMRTLCWQATTRGTPREETNRAPGRVREIRP